MTSVQTTQTMALKDYGNGILASDDRLASIGQQYLAQLTREHEQRKALRAAGHDPAPWGVWSISDRD